jgi:hypothetical protein
MSPMTLGQCIATNVVDDDPLINPPLSRQPCLKTRSTIPRGIDDDAAVNDVCILEELMLVAIHVWTNQLGSLAVKVGDRTDDVEKLLMNGVVLEEPTVRPVDGLEVPLVTPVHWAKPNDVPAFVLFGRLEPTSWCIRNVVLHILSRKYLTV